MLFDRDTLEMLFEEAGEDFAAWMTSSGYDDSWTDQKIYAALPSSVLPYLDDFDLHASWMYGDL